MSNQLVLKNKIDGKSVLTASQRTFNRHCRKINLLREQLEKLEQECEEALVLYHSNLKSKKKETGDLVIQFILKIIDLTQDPKGLSKKERKALKQLIEGDLNLAFSLASYGDIPDKIQSLYQEIHGKSSTDHFYEEMSSFQDMLKEEVGVDHIDLSHLNPNDSPQEFLAKLAQSFSTVMGEERAFSPPPKQKSKQELLKEQKARELETLQSKGISNIYKRLAKELHPDLEQDSKKRAEKDLLMKRLTVAYENRDLVSLLTLESEWLGRFDGTSETLNDATLKIYNSVLKDQIEELEAALFMTHMNPRYIDIHQYTQDCPKNPLKGLENALSEYDEIREQYSFRLQDLSGKNPLQSLKIALKNLSDDPSDEDFLEFIDFFQALDQLTSQSPKTRKKKA